jgi:ABC-type glycerol-3-phosphate transport system permease component
MSASVQQYELVLAEETLLRYAVIVVATVPMLILYPFAQRYFTKGVMLGSLKD